MNSVKVQPVVSREHINKITGRCFLESVNLGSLSKCLHCLAESITVLLADFVSLDPLALADVCTYLLRHLYFSC